MDPNVEITLIAALKGFEAGKKSSYRGVIEYDEAFFEKLVAVFELDVPFLQKAAALDRVIEDQEDAKVLQEVLFDLLMIHFFTTDVKRLDPDYLESSEWEKIEDQTLDRGTELLNVLLYLRECEEENIVPELGDFLKEFLLVEEEEFQDECAIYEDMIANQALMESSVAEIARIAEKVDKDSELRDLFYPVMVFFYEPEPADEDLKSAFKHSGNRPFDMAVLSMLCALYNGFLPG